MTRMFGLASLVAMLMTSPILAQSPTVPFVVMAAPAEDASELWLAGPTGNTSLAVEFPSGGTRIDLPAGPASDQPRAIILEWRDGSRAEFPVFIFPEFATYEVHVRFLHMRKLPKTQPEADKLCRDSRPSDTDFAFEMVFGCRMWAEQLEAKSRKWSREYLWALNGWIIGNRYLFRRTVSADNDQLSPFGYQEPLIARLREALERAENIGWNTQLMRPLNLAEIQDIVLEHEQTLLRYVGQTRTLSGQGQWIEALQLNRSAYDVYQEYVAKAGNPSVYRIDESVLINNIATLRELLRTDSRERLFLEA